MATPTKFRVARERARPLSTTCDQTTLLSFPTLPHSRAALVTRTRRVTDPGGHTYEVSRRARACATAFDHLRPTDTAFAPDPSALACGFSDSNPTCYGPRWPHLRSFASRASVHDHFRPATQHLGRFRSQPCRTHVQLYLLNKYASAIVTDPPTIACALRQPARHLATLHTPQTLHALFP
jgi:hypothetical protein